MLWDLAEIYQKQILRGKKSRGSTRSRARKTMFSISRNPFHRVNKYWENVHCLSLTDTSLISVQLTSIYFFKGQFHDMNHDGWGVFNRTHICPAVQKLHLSIDTGDSNDECFTKLVKSLKCNWNFWIREAEFFEKQTDMEKKKRIKFYGMSTFDCGFFF